MPKYFIAGIPGTGKTKIGEYFQSVLGYSHIELEGGPYNFDSLAQIDAAVIDLLAKKGNLIVTWGFPCHDEFIEFINNLKKGGFRLIWFDGNREAAFAAYCKRAIGNYGLNMESYKKAFRDQVAAIDQTKAHQRIIPAKIIDTFDSSGRHRTFEEITKEIETIN
jgi:nucleoside-triphosphatase THEP1